MTLQPGRSLFHYRLLEEIGGREMGVVRKAEDLASRRAVELKVLPADRSRDETRRRHFMDEARP